MDDVKVSAEVEGADDVIEEQKVELKKEEPVVEEKSQKDKEHQGDSKMHVTDMWGDSRMNPHFLTVAGYFGVTERDYKNAEPKINEILRWAEDETGSKDVGDIVKKIADTSKALQSPGMGEKAYAILYRYIKLARVKLSVEKEMDAYKKAEA
jgi:hypothetical protein